MHASYSHYCREKWGTLGNTGNKWVELDLKVLATKLVNTRRLSLVLTFTAVNSFSIIPVQGDVKEGKGMAVSNFGA